MRFPKLYTIDSTRQMVDTFRGYNHNLRISDGEFFNMKNMTSDYYPVLSPRGKRGVYASGEDFHADGLIAKDALCYVEDGKFFINGDEVEGLRLTPGKKTMISMGAYVIILPDKKYVNTEKTTEYGKIEAEFSTQGPVTFTICQRDGTSYEGYEIRDTEPSDPENMQLWLDITTTPHSLKQWSAVNAMWTTISTTYVKIAAPGIDAAFEQYDGITISGLDGELTSYISGEPLDAPDIKALNGSAVVWAKGDGYIVVVGILDGEKTITNEVTITRSMPEMDFIIERENRLWGCHYGLAANGQIVNEIYASKLGDFKNWNCFMGLSTDSYAASVGTDGPFTGAITHLGHPLFFKEDCVHKIYGNFPANFQIQDTALRGVQRGSERSLAIVNEVLYYKAKHAICAYDGSLPAEVSYAMGDKRYSEAVAEAHGNKYYISMKDDEGYHLFVYDAPKGMWHREDNLQATDLCSCGDELYAIDSNGDILTLLGSGTQSEESVEWMVETGEIGISSPDMKYISRLTIRLSMDIDSDIRVYAKYDFGNDWEMVCALRSNNLRSFSFPVRPRRCDHLKLRIEGEGNVKIYSITKTIEQGSELS